MLTRLTKSKPIKLWKKSSNKNFKNLKMLKSIMHSLFYIVKYDTDGNFTSKQGCIEHCNSKYLHTRLPRRVHIQVGWFLKSLWKSLNHVTAYASLVIVVRIEVVIFGSFYLYWSNVFLSCILQYPSFVPPLFHTRLTGLV